MAPTSAYWSTPPPGPFQESLPKPAASQLLAMSLTNAMWCWVAVVSDVAVLQAMAKPPADAVASCVVVNPSIAQLDESTRNASELPPSTVQLVMSGPAQSRTGK